MPDSRTVGRTARLRVNEIFHSLQGEADAVGYPTVFIRLTGCPLRCRYCDTQYAFHEGRWMSLADILEAVSAFGARHVCVTGGEPLAQPACITLLQQLCDTGYEVSLETSGALDIGLVDARVSRVVDVKTPDSGEVQSNRPENLTLLTSRDQLKFVIGSRADFDWSRRFVADQQLDGRCTILFSPSYGRLPAPQLAQWILDERLNVRFQLQLHKVLWGDVPGR